MRIRSIKPGAFKSETLAQVGPEVCWTFAGLWCYVDDEGRGLANPRLIKSEIYPLRDDYSAEVVEEHLDLLEHKCNPAVICRYEVRGRQYIHVINFHEHQHPNRPTPSKLPPCPHPHPIDGEDSDAEQGGLTESSVSNEEAVKEKEPAAGKPKNLNKGREDVDRLCEYLANWVKKNNGGRRPRITKKWRDAGRLLIDEDGRSVEEIRRVIEWSQKNDFWKPYILSMAKLREKFDTLWIQEKDSRAPSNGRARDGASHQPFTNPADDSVYEGGL